MARTSAANIGKRLAIVLDNHVFSAPVIEEKIPTGQARITGGFDMDEARDLAIVFYDLTTVRIHGEGAVAERRSSTRERARISWRFCCGHW